jgi:hypothetical protein
VKTPDPRIVSWALSGFIVGVLVTLLATGTLARSSQTASPPATLPPASPVGNALLYQNVKKIAVRVLGPASTDVHETRLVTLRVDPLAPYAAEFQNEGLPRNMRSVFIEFRLYDHPLGKAWRLRAAKADVFGLLKALYTSRLPIYDVELAGDFPVISGKKLVETRVMLVFMGYHTAGLVPWKRWGRDNEGRVWNMLDFKHVDSRFA